MKHLIKNGDIILDGTGTRSEKEKEAFAKLETLEVVLDKYGIDDVEVLDKILEVHKFLLDQDYQTLPKEDFDALFEELKKYKDIENELGIDLVTLANVFKQQHIIKKEKSGPYLEVIYETDKYIFPKVNTINLIINWGKKALQIFEGEYLWQEDEELLHLKDYGKTWALTKEELL